MSRSSQNCCHVKGTYLMSEKKNMFHDGKEIDKALKMAYITLFCSTKKLGILWQRGVMVMLF